MIILPIKISPLVPPKDSLIDKLERVLPALQEEDILVITSKVVSISEGSVLPIEGTDKEDLIRSEADWYLDSPTFSHWRKKFTIKSGAFVGSAGVDESNGNGYYVLYPRAPFKTAQQLRAYFRRRDNLKKLGIIITDSTSMPLRRGALGFALAWYGIDPLRDYRGRPDIFDRPMRIELANLVDALAAACVFVMGEGAEQTPVAIVRNAPGVKFKERSKQLDQLILSPDNDLFAPLFFKPFKWRRRKE